MADRDAGKARVIAEEAIHEGFVRLSKVTVELSWQGERHQIVREIHDHGHVAAVMPVDPERRTGILIRQFRPVPFLTGETGWLWEVPGGLLDGQEPADCARQETLEECGVHLRDIMPLGVMWTSPGAVKEQVHLFWGVYSEKPPRATGGLDSESEMIEVHEMPLREIAARLGSGDITDAKSIVALYRLIAARADLFD